MAGRFRLYADADVRGPLIKALRNAGWDVVRAIDELLEGAEDLPHFERAVAQGRVLSPTTPARKPERSSGTKRGVGSRASLSGGRLSTIR